MSSLRAAALVGSVFLVMPLDGGSAVLPLVEGAVHLTAAEIFGTAATLQGGGVVEPCPPTLATEPPCQVSVRSLPGGCGELRVGRVEEASRVAVRAAFHFPSDCNSQLARLGRSLQVVGAPLSRLLPESRLGSWDLGARPAALARVADELLPELAPATRNWLAERMSEAYAAGVDPVTTLLPALGQGIAGGLLMPETGEGAWPLPRPVWLARVNDLGAAQRAAGNLLRFRAGSFAELSGGLVSAAHRREVFAGVPISYLALDSVLDAPLPSPAVAFLHGVVVVSPVRSAVEEVVQTIRNQAGRARTLAGVPPPDAVAVFQADLATIAGDLAPCARVLGRLAELKLAPLDTAEAAQAAEIVRELRALAERWRSVRAVARLVSGVDGDTVVVDAELHEGSAPVSGHSTLE